MSQKLLTLASLLAISAFATGCEELDQFIPKVRFDTLKANQIDFEKANVDFVFQVDNPNPVDIDLASFDYALGLADTPLFSGDQDEGFQLEAVGSSELRLPIDLVWANVWDTINATRGLDVVGFGLDGSFGFDTPIGPLALPYREEGDFPALRTPKFAFEKITAEPFDIFDPTVKLNIRMGVDNPHGSTLFFDQFKGDISLGGKKVATSTLNTFEISGATDGTVNLPVTIPLLELGSGVIDALINGGPLDVGLGAQMDVDTPFGIVPLSIDQTGNLTLD